MDRLVGWLPQHIPAGDEHGIVHGDFRLTLDRADAVNAIDLPMARELLQAAIACDSDDAVCCVVFTGAGRMFCAGGDIGRFKAAGERADA